MNAQKSENQSLEELTTILKGYFERTMFNIDRVRTLISLEGEIHLEPKRQFLVQGDILRAAVVLLHATLEDFLRYLGTLYLPYAEDEVLNRISLVGSNDVLRPEKFFLGRLSSHRGKTIDQVISESVESHLSRISFSDTNDVVRFLETVGVNVSPLRQYLATLSGLMTRRHQIVHCADLVEIDAKSIRYPSQIGPDQVKQWIECVMHVISHVIADRIADKFPPKFVAPAAECLINQSENSCEPPPG